MCYKLVFRIINVDFCAFFVLHSLAILVAMVINCLPSNLPTMYAIILLLGVLLTRGRLPAHVDFSSLVRFKAFLDRTDLSYFLLYCVD